MKRYRDKWIEEWCLENGWSDLQIQENQYWAFRPGAVIPEPIPLEAFKEIKRKKDLSLAGKCASKITTAVTVLSLIIAISFLCPILLVLAFGMNSFAVGNLYLDEI